MSRINNIIKTRRSSQLIVKLVCTGVAIAESLEGELRDYIDLHQDSVEKMKTLYGLSSVNTSVVNHNVFIVYKFKKQSDAKEFEISFIKYIDNSGKNIIDTFLITEAKGDKEDREEFEVILKLPIDAIKALNMFKTLNSVSMTGHPRSPIYRDMVALDGKKVKLLTTDFNLDLMEILYFIGKEKIIRQVPQRWLDISEVTYKAIVNVQWATIPKNIINIKDDGFVSLANEKEVYVPLEILKMDGLTVTLIKHGDSYLNVKNRDQVFTQEMLLFK